MAPEKYDKISIAVVTAVVVMAAFAILFVMGILPGNVGAVPPSVPPPLSAPAEHQPALEGVEDTDDGGEHESEGGEHSP